MNLLELLRRNPLWTATGLLLALYAATYSRVGSVDAYFYFNNLDPGPPSYLYHPPHLAYLLVGKAWYGLWQLFGYDGNSPLPLKSMSLIGALGALSVFARLVNRLFAPGLASLLLFLTFGFSYLPWHYATEAEPVIFFQFFAVWILYELVQCSAGGDALACRPRRLGLAVGLGTLFHQALILVVPLGLAVLGRRGDWPERLRAGRRFLATTLAIVAVAYVGVGYLATHSLAPSDLLAWATTVVDEYSGTHGLAAHLNLRLVVKGAASPFLGASALKPYVYAGQPRDAVFWLAVSVQLVVLGLITAASVLAAFHWRRLDPTLRRRLAVIVVFTGIYVAATLYWEPGNRKFWAPVAPGLLILLGAALCGGGPARRRGRGEIILGLLCLLLLVGNLTGGILGKHRRRDSEQELAVKLLPRFRSGDLLVMESSRLWQCVTYHFPELNVVAVHNYTNAAATAADTTLDHAAASLWRTVQDGHTGFVSERVAQKVGARLTAYQEMAGQKPPGHLSKSFLLMFRDLEQKPQPTALYTWRWLSEPAAD